MFSIPMVRNIGDFVTPYIAMAENEMAWVNWGPWIFW
jgi:hypothetical protein